MSSSTLNAARPIAAAPERYYRRFAPTERVMHALLMLTFIGCALTGVPLLFADHTWAGTLVAFIGGFRAAALIHRICAAIMSVVFVGHVLRVFIRALISADWLGYFWGPNSLVPNLKDGQDIVGMFKWFFGKRSAPAVRPLHLLGEVRLLGSVLGHVHHRRFGIHALVPDLLLRAFCRAGSSTWRRSCTAKKPCLRSASSSRSTSSTDTFGPRSFRWTGDLHRATSGARTEGRTAARIRAARQRRPPPSIEAQAPSAQAVLYGRHTRYARPDAGHRDDPGHHLQRRWSEVALRQQEQRAPRPPGSEPFA